jgi:hypothetical protein
VNPVLGAGGQKHGDDYGDKSGSVGNHAMTDRGMAQERKVPILDTHANVKADPLPAASG